MLADSFRLLVVLWLVVSGNGENIKSFYRKYYRGSHQMASSSLMERDIQEGVKRRLGHFGLFTINDLGIQFKSDLKQWREGIYPRGYEHSIDDKLLSLHHDSSPARESPLTAKWLPVQVLWRLLNMFSSTSVRPWDTICERFASFTAGIPVTRSWRWRKRIRIRPIHTMPTSFSEKQTTLQVN